MSFRTATEADLDQVCALADEIAALHSSNKPKVFSTPDAARDREFWKSCMAQPEATMHVVSNRNEIFGFITAKLARIVAPTFLEPRNVCRSGTIVVSLTSRRQGVGTELIRSVESWAKGQQADEIRLEVFEFNRSALSFYASLGYATQSQIMHKDLE